MYYNYCYKSSDEKATSHFRKKSSTRRSKRRVQRFIQKLKYLKAKQQIQEFEKFSIICMVADPAVTITGEEGIIELVLLSIGQAWNFFVKLGGLLIKFFSNRAIDLLKFIKGSPFLVAFGAFASCALLLINHYANKFGRKLKWYDRLGIIILSLLATLLLMVIIKGEGFKTIAEWLKNVIIRIIVLLRYLNNFIDNILKYVKESLDSVPLDQSEPSKSNDLKAFIFFSALTALTTKYFLTLYKRKVVGDGPFSDLIISIIEIDLTDYLPRNRFVSS